MKVIIKQKNGIDENVAGIDFINGTGKGNISKDIYDWFVNSGYEVIKDEPKQDFEDKKNK